MAKKQCHAQFALNADRSGSHIKFALWVVKASVTFQSSGGGGEFWRRASRKLEYSDLQGTHQYILVIIKRLTLSGKQQQEAVTTMSNMLCFAIMQITASAYFNWLS